MSGAAFKHLRVAGVARSPRRRERRFCVEANSALLRADRLLESYVLLPQRDAPPSDAMFTPQMPKGVGHNEDEGIPEAIRLGNPFNL